MHGSHSLYRLDLEEKVGWDFGFMRTEDAMFGLLVNQHFKNTLGWLKGKLYEQSPFTIKEFIKQRRRWLWGKLEMLAKKEIRLKYKLIDLVSIISWISSLPSIIMTYINLIYPTPIPHPSTSIAFGFCIATLTYTYWEGSRLNLQPTKKDSLRKRILNILAIPIIAPLEGISVWYGLLTYKKGKKQDLK